MAVQEGSSGFYLAANASKVRKGEKEITRGIRIVFVPCERCGKLLATAIRSLYGLDALKARTSILCSDCTTPAEVYELNKAIGEGLIREVEV